jgi:hypothetical protein
MEARVCAGFALAASYWHDDDTDTNCPPEFADAERLEELAAVRAALAARCTGRYRIPQRQRR